MKRDIKVGENVVGGEGIGQAAVPLFAGAHQQSPHIGYVFVVWPRENEAHMILKRTEPIRSNIELENVMAEEPLDIGF